jgi:hypothetical protein
MVNISNYILKFREVLVMGLWVSGLLIGLLIAYQVIKHIVFYPKFDTLYNLIPGSWRFKIPLILMFVVRILKKITNGAFPFIIDRYIYLLPILVMCFVSIFIYFWVYGVSSFALMVSDRLLNHGALSAKELILNKIGSVLEFSIFILAPIILIISLNKFRYKIFRLIFKSSEAFMVSKFFIKNRSCILPLINNVREIMLIISSSIVLLFGLLFKKYMKNKLPKLDLLDTMASNSVIIYLIMITLFSVKFSYKICDDTIPIRDVVIPITYTVLNIFLFIAAEMENVKTHSTELEFHEKEVDIVKGLPEKVVQKKKDISMEDAIKLMLTTPSYKSLLFVKENGKNVTYFFSKTKVNKDSEITKKFNDLQKNNKNIVKYFKRIDKKKYRKVLKITYIIILIAIVLLILKQVKNNVTRKTTDYNIVHDYLQFEKKII